PRPAPGLLRPPRHRDAGLHRDARPDHRRGRRCAPRVLTSSLRHTTHPEPPRPGRTRRPSVSMSQSLEVIVVGGGLGGLTAALAMRQQGLRVTVLERAPELGEVGAGIQTAPNAARVLMGLGLLPELERIKTEPQDQVRRRWKD